MNLEKQLYNLDNKRIKTKARYKAKMQSDASKNHLKNGIYVPKMHLSKNQSLLRYGLSWLYNGFLIVENELVMAVDPGPDFLYRLQISKINPSWINSLFISHAHIDHYASANVLLDWLVRANQKVSIFAPEEVFKEGHISKYHAVGGYSESGFKTIDLTKLNKNKESYSIKTGLMITPVELFHGVECYGFILSTSTRKRRIGYLSDTGYAKKVHYSKGDYDIENKEVPKGEFIKYLDKRENIKKAFENVDVLIANIESFKHTKNSKTHVCLIDVIDILNKAKTKKIILTHINPVGELLYDDWSKKIAKYTEQSTAIKTYTNNISGLKVYL